jgi:glycerophosphoryl diester phosphodiesterase|nr:MAG TPA: distal tail protein [Caudoviricetes sp.]
MAIRTYDILLDSYNSTIPEPIVGRQGDKNGAVTLHVTITDRGTAVDLTGQTINLMAETAKGTAIVADNDGVTVTNATGGKFDYAIPNALWRESGKITRAYFSLNDTDGQQTTYDLIFIVKKAIDISQDKADDYITIIDDTLNSIHKKIDAMNSDVQAALSAYNQENFYNKSETDSKDASTLTSAKKYADAGDSSVLHNAKTYTDSAYPRHQAFRKGTRFFAHRGAQSIAPENSLPAIQRTNNHAGVEIDIHCTSDGKWVVMHDGTVDRMTNGSGAISSFTYTDIRKLRINAGSLLSKYKDSELIIPSLQEALTVCKDKRLIPVLEIKVDSSDHYTSDNWDYLAEIITRYGVQDQMMFISFDFQALQEIKKRLPLVEVSYLVNNLTDAYITQASQLGVNAGLDVKFTGAGVTSENVYKCHQAGLKLGVWTTKDDSNRNNLVGMGVDFITTNSLSGELRYQALDLQNGWLNHSGVISCVEEVSPGSIQLYFAVYGGTNKYGLTLADLPDWAIPANFKWLPCTIRAKRGVSIGSVNLGYTQGGNHISIGLGWNTISGTKEGDWVFGITTYHI